MGAVVYGGAMLSVGLRHTIGRAARLLRMARTPGRFLRLITETAGPPVPLVVPSLSPQPIYIRPGTSDRTVLYTTLWGDFDHAPQSVPRDRPSRIWDLGSNIGLTVALYATELPLARITGVELDAENAALALRNIAAFGDRCDVLTGGVWVSDGELMYAIAPGHEHGARIGDAREGRRAACYSLNTLFAEDNAIDFVKMDIEGAEERVLRENTEWASKVHCIKVECHAPYAVDEAANALAHLGFKAAVRRQPPATALGTRD